MFFEGFECRRPIDGRFVPRDGFFEGRHPIVEPVGPGRPDETIEAVTDGASTVVEALDPSFEVGVAVDVDVAVTLAPFEQSVVVVEFGTEVGDE